MSAIIIPFPVRPTPDSPAGPSVTAHLSVVGLCEQTEEEWFGQAEHVLDQVETMLDRREGRDVITLCERAMWCLLDAAPEIDDGDAVMALLDRLRDLHLRACQLDPPDPLHLAVFVYGLARSETMGVLHGVIDPYVSLLGEDGRAEIRKMLAAELRRVRSARGVARSLLEFRLRPIHASLARGDHPSAV